MLRTGAFLQNRYEILGIIGSGGMSVVYKAKCHKLNRLVAIKVLNDEFSTDAVYISKFKMEAKAAAGLSHPNVVNVYDVVDEGSLHYIVMELIEGITLKKYIQKKGQLEAKETIGIALQVAQGLAAAHEQNLVHRDIKPQNIIISMDGKVKVADFGIARAVTAQTAGPHAIGSVHYISPEQARGRLSDARSDLYSLGITMYEMATGRVPFEGENTVTVALAHLEEPITRPSVYNGDIPLGLEQIILKCTQKKPKRRYQSAAELIVDLRKALLNPEQDMSHRTESGEVPAWGHTRPMTDEEMRQIRENSHSYEEQYESEPSRYSDGYEPEPPRYSGGYEPESPRYNGGYEPEPPRYNGGYDSEPPHYNGGYDSEPPRRGVERDNREKRAGLVLDKFMAAAGVIAAIAIVAVLAVVVMRLGGIFRTGSGGKIGESESGPSVVSESSLDDTQVLMPDVLELPQDMAEAKLKEKTLVMKVIGYEDSDQVEKGRVISQDVDPDEPVSRYSTVGVVISNGSNRLDLSQLSLVGLDKEAAKRLLEGKNLVPVEREETDEKVEKGKVIRFEPESVKEGETVTLYVSTGPAVVMKPVPNLIGVTEEEAIGRLAEAGLTPGQIGQENSDTMEAGRIIGQNPVEGTEAPEGSPVAYVVSAGPKVDNRRYIASLNETYDLGNLIGPGSGSTSVTIMIRLKQEVNGETVYKTLMQPQTLTGNVTLPVNLPVIEGEKGVMEGVVEVVEVNSEAVLKTYPVTFIIMD